MNKDRIFVFINPHFKLGGVDTYFYRMIKWLSGRGIRSILLLTRNAQTDDAMIEQVRELGTTVRKEIEPYPVTNEISPTRIDLGLAKGSDVIVLTTRYAGFFMAQQLRIDNPDVCFTFMNYMTHIHGFKAEIEPLDRSKMSFMRYLYRKKRYEFYKQLTRKVFYSNELFFQNEMHRRSLYEYYGMNPEETMGPDIPLGIDIPPLQEEEIANRNKRRKETFSILTISRFEFPFKGYLLEMVEQFEMLCHKYDNLELVIIGGGPDEDRLLGKIRMLSPQVQKKIKMPGYVDYEKLNEYFCNTSIYIGQGTTVLDAGKRGVLTVPVATYTERCSSYSYLYEYVEIYAPEERVKTSHFIEEVITMSDEDYVSRSRKTYENVKKELDIENVMPQILEIRNTPNRYGMSRLQLKIIKWWYRTIVSGK